MYAELLENLHESAKIARRIIFGTLSRATSSVNDGRWYIE